MIENLQRVHQSDIINYRYTRYAALASINISGIALSHLASKLVCNGYLNTDIFSLGVPLISDNLAEAEENVRTSKLDKALNNIRAALRHCYVIHTSVTSSTALTNCAYYLALHLSSALIRIENNYICSRRLAISNGVLERAINEASDQEAPMIIEFTNSPCYVAQGFRAAMQQTHHNL